MTPSSRARLFVATALAGAAMSLAVSGWSTATATGVEIMVVDSQFEPAVRSVPLGTEVTWVFQDQIRHNTVSRQDFWSSALLNAGETYRTTFNGAGSYPYICEPHQSWMVGRIRVPLSIASSGSGWTIRWSSWATTPGNRRFDVQIKRPGSDTWNAFRTDTIAAKANFSPATAGTYRFRARTENLTAGTTSKWSPVASVVVK